MLLSRRSNAARLVRRPLLVALTAGGVAFVAMACGSTAGNFYGAVDGGFQETPDTYAPADDAAPV